jgi:hypothetical protein
MQTFLPFENFANSAVILDYRRLGKQRVECKQIYQCLTRVGSLRWGNHPAVKMWAGHELSLLEYAIDICIEWKSRGYKDTLYEYFLKEKDIISNKLFKEGTLLFYKKPIWLGNGDFHLSHKSNLLRKDCKHYSQYFPGIPNDLPYIWPTDIYV